ncbi:MAG: oligosaccharide flippase family protein [Ignavibacteria bacterium]
MLAQKLALSYSSKIAVQVVQMIAMFIVARIVGPTVLGTLAFGLAFVSMFLFIADLGLGSAHIKLISEGQDECKCIGTFAILKSGLIMLYTSTILVYYIVQKYFLHIAFESKEHEYVILIYLVITTINQFLVIPNTTFAAKTEQAKQDIPNFLQITLYQILRVVFAILGFTAVGLAFSNLISVVLVIPFYLYLFKGYKVGKFDKDLAKKYFRLSLPLLMIIVVQTIIYSTDRVLLQYLTNSEEVGYYSAGFAIGQFIRLIESSVGLLFFPMFSGLIAGGEISAINNIINKYERFNAIFILPLVALISICSDLVVKLVLGNKYLETIPVLGFINISMYISVLALPYINLISGKGLFKLSSYIYMSSLVVYVGFAFLLVSPNTFNLKGVGIACSLIAVNIFIGILFIIFSKKKIPEVNLLKTKFIILYGIAVSIIFLLVYLYTETILSHILLAVGYLLVYFGIGFLTKIFKIDDIRMVLELLNSKKLLSYINSEMKNKK